MNMISFVTKLIMLFEFCYKKLKVGKGYVNSNKNVRVRNVSVSNSVGLMSHELPDASAKQTKQNYKTNF